MGDNDDCAPLFDGINARFDLFSGNGIETCRRLIEEDDRRILDEHTGNGDALLLTATELQGCGLKAMRQLHDLIIDIGLLGSPHHIVVGGLWVAVFDVLLNGTVENVIFLEY